MRKVVLFLLLICAVVAPYGNYPILSSPLNVTSKAIALILFSFVFSSAALMVLAWGLRAQCLTMEPLGCSNRLSTLAMKEREILAGLQKTEGTSKCPVKGCTCGFPMEEYQV